MNQYPANKEVLPNLPQLSGVYIFKDKNQIPIYIGKAKNLKQRVTSYFLKNLGEKTAQMVKEAKFFEFVKVTSEIEALLLEAKMVKLHMPKYNIELKDDKSPLYIGITRELYPKVLQLRRTQLSSFDLKDTFGPFTQGGETRKIMRNLRRIIPYSTHSPGKRPCIYAQIGFCNPCPSAIANADDLTEKLYLKRIYNKNIAKVKKFLQGKFPIVINSLELEMKGYARNERFEQANNTLRQIQAIKRLSEPQIDTWEYVKNPNFSQDLRNAELSDLKRYLSGYFNIDSLARIECFDIAHLAGSHPTASMVTFINAEAEKTLYRHFSVKTKAKGSDVDSMKHILTRRLSHLSDWGKPDLIIVDGGKPQVSAVNSIVPVDIALVGLAKRYETLVIPLRNDQGEIIKYIESRVSPGPALNLIQRIRDEAHRFARRLHHKHILTDLIK